MVILVVFRCVCLRVSLCVLVVTDVSVSPSMVSVLGENVCSASKSEFVEPQSFLISGKRRALFLESQGSMSIDTAEQMPPVSRRRVNAIEGGVDHRWAAFHQAVATRMVKYLDRSESLKVNIKELECFLLVSDEPNVDIKHIALHARGNQQQLFHTFARQEGTKSGWRVLHVGISAKQCSSYTSSSARNSAKQLSKWARGKNCWLP